MRKIVYIVAVVALLASGVLGSSAQPLLQTPSPNQINEVARELWCPLCNGVRLDNCDLQACVQMKEVISQKLEAGESTDSIKTYFVQQYGDVVLGQPPREGFNLIAYIFPILAALVGIGWVTYLVLVWRKRQTQLAPADAGAGRAARGPLPSTGLKPGEEGDDYMKRVERALRDTE